jgi:putative ABC transport system permease protein
VSGVRVLLEEVGRSWRTLLRRPGYLALAVLTLGLGVGTITVVHALLHQALLRPLPFPDPQRLVTLGIEAEPGQTLAAPRYYAPLRSMRSVEAAGMVMGWTTSANIGFGDQAEVAVALRADRGFVETMGLPIAVGRNFDDAENSPNGPMAILLGHGFWRTRFAADPAAVGRSMMLEGRAVPVVGVLSEDLHWPDRFDIMLSLQPDLADTDLSTNQLIVARLRPAVTIGAAAAETKATLNAMLAADAGLTEGQREYLVRNPPTALPLSESVFARRTGDTLWMFLGAAACVLLIAAINLASLMLLRMLARSHASAVRTALGASLLRLSLPALGEGLLVGALGSAAGLLLARIGLELLGGLVPAEWMRGQTVSLSATSFGFAFAAGIVTALVAAVLGAMRGRRRDWARDLIGGARAGWAPQVGRLGRALVIAQIAVAVVLLAGAALFARSVQKLESVPMGFESRSITTFTLALLKERYTDSARATEETRRIIERIERIPGVERAGASTNLPTASQLTYSMVLPDQRTITGQYRLSTPGFLDVVGVRLLAGRRLDDRDTARAEPVCLVSASFSRQHLGGEPLGKLVTLPDVDGKDLPMRVVGVVGDVRQFGPVVPAQPTLYAPLAQIPPPLWALLREFGPLSYAVKLHAGLAGVDERALRTAIQEVAPQQPISNVSSMEAIVASTISQQRLNLLLVGLFASLALLLASVGLYSVMAVAVAARRHEFGVRAALGASKARLLGQVLREALWQIGLGLAIGLAGAMALSRLLHRFLFGVGAADPVAITIVLLTLSVAGLLASLLPALRASRVPPMQALRIE